MTIEEALKLPGWIDSMDPVLKEISLETAVARQKSAEQRGLKDKYGAKGLSAHEIGTDGEAILCVHQGIVYEPSVDTFKSKPDVGGVEVRTRVIHTHDLIIRPDDKDDAIFVLVTGKFPGPWRVCGWTYGREAKQDRYWKNHGGKGWAWFYPQKLLRDMEDFKFPGPVEYLELARAA